METILYKGLNDLSTCGTNSISSSTRIFVPNNYNENTFCSLPVYKITRTCGKKCFYHHDSNKLIIISENEIKITKEMKEIVDGITELEIIGKAISYQPLSSYFTSLKTLRIESTIVSKIYFGNSS